MNNAAVREVYLRVLVHKMKITNSDPSTNFNCQILDEAYSHRRCNVHFKTGLVDWLWHE